MDASEETGCRPGDFTADQRQETGRLERKWRDAGEQPQAAHGAAIKHVAGGDSIPGPGPGP